jgi:oligoendopeptidase F
MEVHRDLPTWDLSDLYRGLDDPALARDVAAVLPAAQSFREEWRGRVASAEADGLAEAVRAYESLSASTLRPWAFASLLFAADSREAAHVALLQRVKEVSTSAHKESLFFPLEVDAISDAAFALALQHPDLAAYRHWLAQSRAHRAHRLSEPEEAVLALKDLPGRSAFVQLYGQLTAGFRFPFELDGEDRELTGAELLALLKHPDRGVRRRAYECHAAAYAREAVVLTSVWNALILDHRQDLTLRAYQDPMEPVHLGNEVSIRAVDVLREVTREHYHLCRRYYRWKARALGVERLWNTDMVAPLPGPEPVGVSFDTARGWVLEAFAAFHPQFAAAARSFFEEQRIDARPRPGKRGGAFCMGVGPQLPVYVLMNHTGKLRDAATLAHELGHGVHFTLARAQPLLEYSPVLPMAETASVFGELLLTRQLLGRDLDPAARRSLLAERVEDVIATTFRQNLYVDFEYRAHQEGAVGYLSAERLGDLWVEQLDAAYGQSVEQLPAARWYWSAIPHFVHTRFYCYAYVFGQLFVLALFRRYLEEGAAFAPRVIELLASGGSRAPADLAAALEYDLEDPAFWAGGYRVLDELLGELETL